ncbi:MAG: AMP-binding protein, partial [Candidatus Omnitrophota bacterium]
MAENLIKKFEETAIKHSHKIAIQYKTGEGAWTEISYGKLKSNIESLSAFLSEQNLKKDEKVAILLENRPEWPAIFFSTLSLGAISIPINPEASQKEIENILINSGCKIAFVGAGSFLLKENLVKKLPFIKKVISINSDAFKNITAVQPRNSTCEGERRARHGDDLACILYTSGTTDEPKGVMLSHKNLLSNCDSVYKTGLITEKDSIISVLPLHHAYPLTVTMLLPLLYGSKIIYPGTMRGEALLEAMKEINPTVFIAVPQIFYSFHQKITEKFTKIPFPFNLLLKIITGFLYKIRNKTGMNLARCLFYSLHRKFGKSMRLFASGGAKLDENIERDLFKFGFTILEGYGLTETSPVLTFNPLKKPKIGSVGLPVPGVELKIVDKDEQGVGEVIARGTNIMKGYYKREDLTADVIKDGWFHTGDLGYIDREGYLFLTGRSKDVIVLSSGLNINPEEIEQAYSKEAPLKEMCVFEVPAKKGAKEAHVLWAVCVPDLEFFRKYGEVNLRHVVKERFDNVSRTLPPSKRLMGFSIILDELPHTLLGKIKRFAVKEIYTPRIIKEEYAPGVKKLSSEDKKLAESYCGKKIINYLKEQTKTKGPVVPPDSLEIDLGIDSLGRIDLAVGLEKLFDIEIKDEIIGQAFTVRDLILGMESLLAKGAEELATEEKGIVFDGNYWKRVLNVHPKSENLKKIDLRPGFVSWLAGFIFTYWHWLIFKLFYSLKVEGKENFPKSGSYILYVNHTSYFDG